MPELNTARLFLRCFAEDDLDELAGLAANEGFMRFSGSGSMGRAQAAVLFERIMLRTRANLPAQFAVFDREKKRMLGFCGFFSQTVDGTEKCEIAYRLHPDYWGNGFATEAARAVRDHAFRDLKLERVISLIHPENQASRRVAEKNGMLLERETIFRTFPTLIFAIDHARWKNLRDDA